LAVETAATPAKSPCGDSKSACEGGLRDGCRDLQSPGGITEMGIFGSYVRGEQRPDSDVDILIEVERPPRISLIGLVEIEYYLSELLEVKADLAIRKNLRKRIGQRILGEVIPV
jgi:uncharacterized protein